MFRRVLGARWSSLQQSIAVAPVLHRRERRFHVLRVECRQHHRPRLRAATTMTVRRRRHVVDWAVGPAVETAAAVVPPTRLRVSDVAPHRRRRRGHEGGYRNNADLERRTERKGRRFVNVDL